MIPPPAWRLGLREAVLGDRLGAYLQQQCARGVGPIGPLERHGRLLTIVRERMQQRCCDSRREGRNAPKKAPDDQRPITSARLPASDDQRPMNSTDATSGCGATSTRRGLAVIAAVRTSPLVLSPIDVGACCAVAAAIAGMGLSWQPVVAVMAVSFVLPGLAVVLAPFDAGADLPCIGVKRTRAGATIPVGAGLSRLLVQRTSTLTAARAKLARYLDHRTYRSTAEGRAGAEAEARLRHAGQGTATGRRRTNVVSIFAPPSHALIRC